MMSKTSLNIFLAIIFLLLIVNAVLFYHIIEYKIFIILSTVIFIFLITYIITKIIFSRPKFKISSNYNLVPYDEPPELREQFNSIIFRTNFVIHKRIILVEVMIIIILLVVLALRLLNSGG